MNNPNFRDKGSTLSKFIWELKDEGVNFQIKWRIVDRAPPYNPRTRKCMLCTKEAYYINYHKHMATLNKRKENLGPADTAIWRLFPQFEDSFTYLLNYLFIYFHSLSTLFILFKVNYFMLFFANFPFPPP